MKSSRVVHLFSLAVICLFVSISANATTPANLINWNGNLVADFGDNGMWYHDGSSWNWMTNTGNVGQMVVWDNKLVVDFGTGKGLYYFDGTWHWMTNKADPNMMVAWSNGTSEVLVVDFGAGQRIYTYDGTWNWFKNKDGVAGMTVWDNQLVVDFGAGRGLYNYDGSWNWMSNKDDVNLMLSWDNGTTERLVVDFGGGRRIYTYNGSWSWFTNKDDVNAMTVWSQELVVDFGGGRYLYTYDTSWHWINNKDDVARMVTWKDGVAEKLAVDFGGGRGLYYYDGSWHWIKNDDNVAEMIAWGNRLAVDFSSEKGLYYYDGSWHQLKDWSTYEPPAPIPETGQTTCYNNTTTLIPCPLPGEDFYGQDACYTINPPSYTKLDGNGNELGDEATEWAMVRDNVTGLIWEVKTDDGGIHDKDNTYTWYDSNPETNGGNAGTPGDGTDTEDFIAALNSSSFGGHNDWRLPTNKELSSLVDMGSYNQAINTTYFPGTMFAYYWSSTPDARVPTYAWRVDFNSGPNNYYDKSSAYYVRAVRGEQSSPSYTDNGNGTVTDNVTGLMWAQDTADVNDDGLVNENDTLNWQAALAWCEALSLAGYSDWRLPNVKELSSIVDYDIYNPAIDTTYFPGTMLPYYWSSTTRVHYTGDAWRVNFYYGYDNQNEKVAAYYVRAVRGGQ